ncbi:hypothetical protein FLACOL_01880 [Flavobacterium columnare]|uniref:Lipoprotein-associated type-17 domain-containing protein n=3 Tax=Flavobacterium TaxID=237 RepID=A0A2N9PBZ7_9FLAO|nr:hypothetical protein [Flavobacterium columnare]RVU90267.1 hypothetical protein EH230_04770 [Flavobacterium columnare]SPE77870.1 hypothetical protein FLACOL_01880 [Flavobacterium columnare]
MKEKVIWGLAMVLIMACSKEEQVLTNGEVITDSGVVKNAEIEEEDLYQYYGIKKDQNVGQVTSQIETIKGLKEINGKKIEVKETVLESKDEEKGIVIVKFLGKVNDKNFSKIVTFQDLVKKPSQVEIARNLNVEWKKEYKDNPESLPIAFDELYRLKKTDKFTLEYLSKWIDFYVVPRSGANYYLTNEDLKQSTISEVTGSDRLISFNFSYKGTRNNPVSVSFDKNKYYERFVSLNRTETSKYFAQGILTDFGSFFRGFLNLKEEQLFELDFDQGSERLIDRNEDKISCKLILKDKKNKIIADFYFEFEGFKSLKRLKTDWYAESSGELNFFMANRMRGVNDGDVTSLLERTIARWVTMVKMGIIRDDINTNILDPQSYILVSNGVYALKMVKEDASTTWKPSTRRALYQDALWLLPRFKLIKAIKKENTITVTLSFVHVNEVSLSNVQTTFNIVY